jgi:hypothetical protein
MYSQLQEEAVDASATGDAVADAPDETSVDPQAGDAATAVARRPSSLASLKAEIARAMQVAADRERERIEAGVGAEETAQVEKIVGRAAAEAAELSKHADEDVSLVDAWYRDEVKRIRAEADRRIEDRRTTLEQSLTHHGSLIEAEIESVHAAVLDYRGSLGAFFGRLAEEKEPSAIARLAGDLPDPPDLDDVRAEARSASMQALEHGSAETPDPTDKSAANGNGRVGPDRELVPVMEQRSVKENAGSLNGTSVVATAEPAESMLAADEPWLQASSADAAETTESPTEAAPQPGVATRLLRALKSRTTPPAEGPQAD